jgi:hypothetical protein
MPLRLLKYNVAVIEAHLKQKNKTFPIVVNTVLYTGKQPWKHSTTFDDYYTYPELGAQFLHLAPFHLIQLPEDQNDLIYQDQTLGLYFAAFRSCRDNDPYTGFAKFMEHDWFPAYFNHLPFEEKELIARDIGWCVNREQYDLEKVLTLITNNQQETQRIMTSVAQQYVNQGVEQGIQLGKQEGKQEGILYIAKNMLRNHVDISFIRDMTGLSIQDIKTL